MTLTLQNVAIELQQTDIGHGINREMLFAICDKRLQRRKHTEFEGLLICLLLNQGYVVRRKTPSKEIPTQKFQLTDAQFVNHFEAGEQQLVQRCVRTALNTSDMQAIHAYGFNAYVAGTASSNLRPGDYPIPQQPQPQIVSLLRIVKEVRVEFLVMLRFLDVIVKSNGDVQQFRPIMNSLLHNATRLTIERDALDDAFLRAVTLYNWLRLFGIDNGVFQAYNYYSASDQEPLRPSRKADLVQAHGIAMNRLFAVEYPVLTSISKMVASFNSSQTASTAMELQNGVDFLRSSLHFAMERKWLNRAFLRSPSDIDRCVEEACYSGNARKGLTLLQCVLRAILPRDYRSDPSKPRLKCGDIFGLTLRRTVAVYAHWSRLLRDQPQAYTFKDPANIIRVHDSQGQVLDTKVENPIRVHGSKGQVLETNVESLANAAYDWQKETHRTEVFYNERKSLDAAALGRVIRKSDPLSRVCAK